MSQQVNQVKDEQILLEYMEHNKVLLNNPITKGFLEDPTHLFALVQYLCSPSVEIKRYLEDTFKRYYFRIRFTKYLASLIRFCDIDYHRKRHLTEERNPLIFDSPVDDDGDVNLGELLHNLSASIEDDIYTRDPEFFQQSFYDDNLYFAFKQLTDKQKFVITISYSSSALDTDIAEMLQISQQSISKTRQSALKKMRKYIEGDVVLLDLVR